MTERLNKIFSIRGLFVFYWAMLWLMNGLDKFLNRKNLSFFTWFGKDRTEQFSEYFDKVALPDAWIEPLLIGTGIWELLVALPFILVFGALVFRGYFDEAKFRIGMFLGGVTFTGFCFFDIIFGDRAELLEHSTFLVLIGVTYVIVMSGRDYVGDSRDPLSVR